MSITLDDVSGTNTFAASSSAKSVSHAIGSGANRLLIALIGIRIATLSSVTFNGTAMNLVSGFPIASGGTPDFRLYIYYLLDASLPSAGTYNLTATPSGSGGYGVMGCLSVFGAKQDAPEATGSGSSTSSQSYWANNITTLTNGAWIFELSQGYDRTFTPTTPQTEIFDVKDGTNTGVGASRKEFATAGATTMGQTPNSSTPYAQGIVAFAPFVDSYGGNFFPYF